MSRRLFLLVTFGLAVLRLWVERDHPVLLDVRVESRRAGMEAHWSDRVAAQFGQGPLDGGGEQVTAGGAMWTQYEPHADANRIKPRPNRPSQQLPIRGSAQPLIPLNSTFHPPPPPSAALDFVEREVFELGAAKLAIVIPLPATKSQLAYLESNMRGWASEHYAPCVVGNKSGKTKELVDLVFYTGQDENLQAVKDGVEQILARIRQTSNTDWLKQCFKSVRFISAGLAKEDDVYAVARPLRLQKRCGVVMMFEGLFTLSAFNAKQYDYFFWMEPDTRPLRPGWVDRLVSEASLAMAAGGGGVWSVGSAPQYELDACALPVFETHHINGNALYRSGGAGFADYVHWAMKQRPDSIDFGLFEYRMRCDMRRQSQDLVHRFRYSDFILNSPRWSDVSLLRLLNSSHTMFAHGKETVGMLAGVLPCGTAGNQHWPINAQSVHLCPQYNPSTVLSPEQITSTFNEFASKPFSPWGTDLSLAAQKEWEKHLKHDFAYEEARFHLMMRVPEKRGDWCLHERQIDCRGKHTTHKCWRECATKRV